MTESILDFVLLAAFVAVSIGCARIVSWLLDRRDHTARQQSRETQVITLAKAAISAPKRGNLLTAVRYSEERETAHV